MPDDKTIGARRRRNANPDNVDMHATGRAARTRRDDVHATGRAARRGAPPAAEDNLRPFEQKDDGGLRQQLARDAKAAPVQGWPAVFRLDGVDYRNEGILSDTSGEALIFTVSRDGRKYVLKLYYYDPDHRPNHAILEKIHQLQGSGLLVNIVSHGEWQHPGRPG